MEIPEKNKLNAIQVDSGKTKTFSLIKNSGLLLNKVKNNIRPAIIRIVEKNLFSHKDLKPHKSHLP